MINSRNKGNQYERQIMNELKELGYKDCKTSRNESKATDDKGIDLCYTGNRQIQIKNYKTFSVSKAIKTLKDMPAGDNILIIKITRVGECVVMDKELFYNLIQKLNGL